MDESERRRIESEARAEAEARADMLHAIKQNSDEIKSLRGDHDKLSVRIDGYVGMIVKMAIAGSVYLFAQVWNFISGGGVIK